MTYRALIESACRAMGLSAAETAIVLRYAPRKRKAGYTQALRCYSAIVRSMP